MRHRLGLCLLCALCFMSFAGILYASEGDLDLLSGVEHWRQSTIRITGDKVIYFDPFKVEGEPRDGDLILITHTHPDHLSPVDIQKVMKPGATLIVPPDGVDKLNAIGLSKIVTVAPYQRYEVDGLKFETVPSYNTNKPNHPKANNWVGYVVSLNDHTFYMAGDTDLIPEMRDLKVDVAFLPIGGTYTMNAKEAAEAADLIGPAIAVPIHFVDVVGTWADADGFLSLLDERITGVILKKK